MNSNIFYVPILKNKRGELTALQHLKVKSRCCPMIQLLPDEATPRRVNTLLSYWARDNLFFLDSTFITDVQHLRSWLSELIKENIAFIPVINPLSPSEVTAEMLKLPAPAGFCVRLILSNPGVSNNLSLILSGLTQSTSLKLSQTDMLLDLGEIRGETHFYVHPVREVCREVYSLGAWRSVTLTGSAFPSGLPPESVNNFIEVERKAWKIWNNIKLEYPINFGDYTIQSVDLQDFSGIDGSRIAYKLRYATKDSWLIAKGRGGNKQDYKTLASMLARSSDFCGETFSWGDKKIFDCANGIDESGGPGTRVTIDVNHHIEHVLTQI